MGELSKKKKKVIIEIKKLINTTYIRIFMNIFLLQVL